MNISQAILLNGTSSAGKSSIAKQIQLLSGGVVAHMHIDMFLEVFNFRQLPNPKQRRDVVETAIELFHLSIADVCKKPFPIIIDTVFQEHEQYLSALSALSSKQICFVGVHCDLEEAQQREVRRGDRPIGLVKFQYDRVHTNKAYDFEVNTTTNSPEFCAKEILKFINNGATET